MSNIKDKVQQLGNTIVLMEAYTKFQLLAAAFSTDKSVSINVLQNYLSEYDVVDELRQRVKNKEQAPSEIKPLLDPQKKITDVISENNFTKLAEYIYQRKKEDYEPPLDSDFKSYTNKDTVVRSYPNTYKDKDPRRSARLFILGPDGVMNSWENRKWLYNNSLLYGFLPYGNFVTGNQGLYWVGIDKVKDLVKSIGVEKTVGTYLSATPEDLLKNGVTKDQVLSSNIS